jgi:hypothetical protein
LMSKASGNLLVFDRWVSAIPRWKSGRPFGQPVFYSLSVDGNNQKPCEERCGRLEKRKSHEQTISVPQKVMLGDVWKWLCCAGFEAIELLLITLCRPG